MVFLHILDFRFSGFSSEDHIPEKEERGKIQILGVLFLLIFLRVITNQPETYTFVVCVPNIIIKKMLLRVLPTILFPMHLKLFSIFCKDFCHYLQGSLFIYMIYIIFLEPVILPLRLYLKYIFSHSCKINIL